MEDNAIMVPLEEYEELKRSHLLHGKEDIIKDLQFLLNNKEEDLKRFREKYEQCVQVLKRTQSRLDNCLKNYENSNKNQSASTAFIPLIIPSEQAKRKEETKGLEMIARDCVAVQPRGAGEPTENEEPTTYSLPVPTSTQEQNATSSHTERLKSLPAHLGNTPSPSASTQLLRALIQENVKLKASLEKKNTSGKYKPVITSEAESKISKLKLELSNKENKIEELSLRSDAEVNDKSDLNTEKALQLSRTVEKQQKTLDLNKIVIESLKQERDALITERDNTTKLLHRYQELQGAVNDDQSEATIEDLQKKLDETKESRILLTDQLEISQSELETERKERNKLQQRYDNLVKQYQLARMNANTEIPPASPSLRNTNMSRSTFQPRQQLSPPSFRQSDTDTYRAPPLPPRISTEPVRSSKLTLNSSSRHTAPVSQPPQPADRKTYKCPRCVAPFKALEDYRQHIKICLQK